MKKEENAELRQKVLEFLLQIPKGKVVTYKMIGEKFGIHPRTVALFMKGNKQPEKLPCYKVINNDGRIGGYNLGTAEKIKKLGEDGIKIKDGKIDKEFLWKS